MEKTQLIRDWFRRVGLGMLMLLTGAVAPAWAQETCLLEPIPLSQRVAAATLIVEARVAATRSQDEGAHLITLNELEVFKVFRGSLPAQPLTVATAGGTVGLRREVVTNSPALHVGDQAVFFLEPDPRQAGRYRLYAGPQGLISYDLEAATAAEPFARYASIEDELYAALEKGTGQALRSVRPNEPLRAARAREAARSAAPPVVLEGFSPAVVAAGTGAVLTIRGSGFGDVQGTGKVSFRNANNGGSSFTSPLAADYVSWTDTEIRVRVPAATTADGPAGTGPVQVSSAAGGTATSAATLTVSYALSNLDYQSKVYPVALVSTNGLGGYDLQYNARFAANTAAKAAFERALATWRNGAGTNHRALAATTTINTNANDNVNVVSFDDGQELAAGVLGVTYSYYSGCNVAGVIKWALEETDYIYDEERNWQFTTGSPSGGQFDFETVVLHEQGHGIQLGHIIKPGAVMHYAIAANTQNRVLNPANDVAGANAQIDVSLASVVCGLGKYVRLGPAAGPLPVSLLSFTAEAGSSGVQLRWRTAAEVGSAFFAVETTLTPTGAWTELARVAAAGTTSSPQSYDYLDVRPLTAARYYRLRQQDADGTIHYSAVVTVTPGAVTEPVAYPNPFTTELQVQLPAAPAASLRLLDVAGRSVYSLAVPAAQTFLTLALPELRPGVYLLEWRGAGQTKRIRLLRQ